jgi:hypothetical protein
MVSFSLVTFISGFFDCQVGRHHPHLPCLLDRYQQRQLKYPFGAVTHLF